MPKRRQTAPTPLIALPALLPALLAAMPAMAQAAAPAPGALDAIVVTASAGDRSRLDSAVSVGSIAAADVARFNATSTAELYRLIPGIQVAGTQGDGGNSAPASR